MCNTSANYTSKFWILIGWKTMGNSVGQWYHVKWWQKFWKKLWKTFCEWEKMPALYQERFTLATDDTIERLQNGAKNIGKCKMQESVLMWD